MTFVTEGILSSLRIAATVSLAALLGVSLLPVSPESSAPANRSVIVRSHRDALAASEAVSRAGGTVVRSLPIVDGVAALVPAHAERALRAMPEVLSVTPNHPVRVAEDDDDDGPSAIKTVYAQETGAERLWRLGIDGSGVRVALIDTGITDVPDLAGRMVGVPHPVTREPGQACVDFSGENTCRDNYGHGTFMAGLIAGSGRSSDGAYRGMAPGAELVSVKIAGRDGSADVSKLLAAIQWVVSFSDELRIRVLNLSLSTNSRISYRLDPLNFAVERAWRAGIAVVVAAGNRGRGDRTITKPGDDPLVITVGAVDDRETPAVDDDRSPFFSSRGPTFGDLLPKPDVVAPGALVISLRSPGSYIDSELDRRFGPSNPSYRRGSGTSMSAAVLSGAVALILQAKPGWTSAYGSRLPDRVKHAITTTARGVAEREPAAVGAGIAQADAAAFAAPGGLANSAFPGIPSDGTGSLDGSRGDAIVTSMCRPFESLLDPACDRLHGDRTAQDMAWDGNEYKTDDWSAESWYASQWSGGGAGWEGSSWYGSDWTAGEWAGSSWYGGSDSTPYGVGMTGSSWYGASAPLP